MRRRCPLSPGALPTRFQASVFLTHTRTHTHVLRRSLGPSSSLTSCPRHLSLSVPPLVLPLLVRPVPLLLVGVPPGLFPSVSCPPRPFGSRCPVPAMLPSSLLLLPRSSNLPIVCFRRIRPSGNGLPAGARILFPRPTGIVIASLFAPSERRRERELSVGAPGLADVYIHLLLVARPDGRTSLLSYLWCATRAVVDI